MAQINPKRILQLNLITQKANIRKTEDSTEVEAEAQIEDLKIKGQDKETAVGRATMKNFDMIEAEEVQAEAEISGITPSKDSTEIEDLKVGEGAQAEVE